MKLGFEVGGGEKPSGSKRADDDPLIHFLHGRNDNERKGIGDLLRTDSPPLCVSWSPILV